MYPCSQTEPDVPAPGARPDESVVRGVLSCYSGQSRSQHTFTLRILFFEFT